VVGLEHSQHQIVYIESVVASYQVRAVKGDDAIAVGYYLAFMSNAGMTSSRSPMLVK